MATVHLTEDALCRLHAIRSDYDDLLALMDCDIPERTFLRLLNDQFSAVLTDLGKSANLSALGSARGQGSVE